MYTKGYDSFFFAPGEQVSVLCRVCGTTCQVRRNVMGPMSYAEALAKKKRARDLFTCPNANVVWHQRVLKLVQEKEQTQSKRIRVLLDDDIKEILNAPR